MAAAVTTAERSAIQRFCRAKRKLDDETAELRETKKRATETKKRARDALYALMREEGRTCVQVDDENYLRVKTYTNKRALTAKIVADALRQVTADDLRSLQLEAGGSVTEALVRAVANRVARERETRKEYVAITKSRPRGCAAAVGTPSARMEGLVRRYRAAESSARDTGKALDARAAPLAARVDQERENVGRFMRRTMATSQRVHVARGAGVVQTYFIRRKITRRRKRLSAEQLGDILRDAVLGELGGGGGGRTIEAAVAELHRSNESVAAPSWPPSTGFPAR